MSEEFDVDWAVDTFEDYMAEYKGGRRTWDEAHHEALLVNAILMRQVRDELRKANRHLQLMAPR